MLAYENYHCHSMYSNCLTQPDSTMKIEDYAKVYRERGMQVLCLSEHGNRSNVWQQQEMAQKYSTDGFQMKPLAAAECYFVPDRNPELKDRRNFHLILIARDMEGYRQLNGILTEANLSGYYYKPRVDFELLSRLDARHFLCTTACVAGPMRDENAEAYLMRLKDIFRDSLYLEVQHHPQQVQLQHNAKLLSLYRKTGVPLIYGTDSHYIRHEDTALRKELLLSSGIKNDYEDDFDLFLPTAEEAYQLLLNQHILSPSQIREAMENTLQLRDFEGVHFSTEKKIPTSHPELTMEERNKLYMNEVKRGYTEKAGTPYRQDRAALYDEMNAVVDTGTADYFISMKDIVDRGVRYGGVLTTTGRGSGVSFATNYALGFTSINRLKCPVKLYPERFISKERLASGALPDLDLNMSNVPAFEKAGKEILGEWGCLPMVAFGTCKVLSAFKLLARARDLDFETSNEISRQLQTYETDLKHAKENNQDDPDYNVDLDICLEDYVDEKYLSLVEDSKQYRGIITSLSPHPCAHLLLDKDLREEIGVIRVKAKSGNKEPVFAAYIDGQTADAFGYLKADYLRVDVVKTIAAAFEAIGQPVMSVDELLNRVNGDPKVWQLYEYGFTLGLNQCEKEKTTERVMRYKPTNVVELAAFVAAVRPGFKSMLETFVSRAPFKYGIPSLDKLLQTREIPSSFLMYDEQILTILQAAGIPAADAYTCVKAIKKKKADKVKSFRDRFETGFTQLLKEREGATDEEAREIVNKIWTIINDAAAYMFCAAHAFSMACDSLYAAWLKAYYPYEFYVTMLKLYTEKGNKEKIALTISEMKRYLGIRISPGRFGEDNRDWLVNKETKTISQSLHSIKFISASTANALYQAGLETYESFTQVLYKLQELPSINTRQIAVLIKLGYFSGYGASAKLMKIFDEYFNGKNKITKTLSDKTKIKRLTLLTELERSLPEEELPIEELVAAEYAYVLRCSSTSSTCPKNTYFVEEADDMFGVRIRLYNLTTGRSGVMRMTKRAYAESGIRQGQFILLNKWHEAVRRTFRNGKMIVTEGKTDIFLDDFTIKEQAA